MEKRKKEYFDHALDRAIDRAAMILDDLRFIRKMHREGQDELTYTYTLGMVEAVENMTRNARELVLSQRTPTGKEEVQRIVDDNYKIEMGFTKEGWFGVRIPLIIPKRKGYSVKYMENRLRSALHSFWENRPRFSCPCSQSIIVFRHVYARSRSAWQRCVPADYEVDAAIRLLTIYVLNEIYPIDYRHYHCCAIGESEYTEVFVMPSSDFEKWRAKEPSRTEFLQKVDRLYESIGAAILAEEEEKE